MFSPFKSPIASFPLIYQNSLSPFHEINYNTTPNWVCPRHRLAASKEPPGGIPKPGQTALVPAFSVNQILPFFFPVTHHTIILQN